MNGNFSTCPFFWAMHFISTWNHKVGKGETASNLCGHLPCRFDRKGWKHLFHTQTKCLHFVAGGPWWNCDTHPTERVRVKERIKEVTFEAFNILDVLVWFFFFKQGSHFCFFYKKAHLLANVIFHYFFNVTITMKGLLIFTEHSGVSDQHLILIQFMFWLPYAFLSFCKCPRLPVWTSRSFSGERKYECEEEKWTRGRKKKTEHKINILVKTKC